MSVEGFDGDDLLRAAREAIAEHAKNHYEPIFNRVATRCQGQSAERIKAELRRELQADGTDPMPSDAGLAEWAEALTAGGPVTITVSLPF